MALPAIWDAAAVMWRNGDVHYYELNRWNNRCVYNAVTETVCASVSCAFNGFVPNRPQAIEGQILIFLFMGLKKKQYSVEICQYPVNLE